MNRLDSPRFVMGGSEIVAANVDGENVLYYTAYDLSEAGWDQEKEDSRPAASTIDIYPGTVLESYVTEDYMVVLYPNQDTSADASHYTSGTVHYFEGDTTLSFLLRNEEDAPDRVIYGDRIYYFERISAADAGDAVFELKVLELSVNMNRISTGLRVVNAAPKVLAADSAGPGAVFVPLAQRLRHGNRRFDKELRMILQRQLTDSHSRADRSAVLLFHGFGK